VSGRRGVAAAALAALLAASSLRAEEWFDAYSRGLEALKQKQGPRAAQLFERAIRLRPDPGTNLLTYGTNRLDRYHPYLRLAEAHLLAGEPEKARDALARSETRGKEPADERARLAALVSEAVARSRGAAATPPPVPAATPPPPTTLAQAPPPVAPTPAAALAPPPPTTLAAARLPPPGHAAGILDLRSEPAGATALMDGRLLGTTPLKLQVDAGLHQVTLRKEGSADLTFATKIEPGKTVTEQRALVATTPVASAAPPTPAEASLVVYSDPPGASVYVDDEPLGATNADTGRLVKTGLTPGDHRIRLSLPGRVDFAQEARLAAGGPTTVRASLAPASSRPNAGTLALGAFLLLALVLGGVLLWRRRAAVEVERTVALPPRRGVSGSDRAGQTPTPARTIQPGRTEMPLATLAGEDAIETRAVPSSPRLAAPNEPFGEYRLEEQLGKGGMAVVFKAERRGERCALKRPLTAFLEDPEFLERFLREAEIGRTLHHPNIIRIFERGDVAGVPYFTMELIEGETLQALVKRNGAITPRKAAGILAQVAEALDYAHLKGVVHRDLKPSNIMLMRDGIVKVMDYGIARARRFEGLTITGAFLGTPDYVAPETAEGKGSDARSDLYSLGIVFYEMLTGKKPFVGDTPFATLRKHCTEAPTPPSALSPEVPCELEEIVLRLMSKDPAERYPGAEELLIALRTYLNRAA
jgi:predicted Ser/Thr protein kinase